MPYNFRTRNYRFKDAWDIINSDIKKESYFTRSILYATFKISICYIENYVNIWQIETLRVLMYISGEDLIDYYAKYIALVIEKKHIIILKKNLLINLQFI